MSVLVPLQPKARAEFAPTGKLRVGLNYSNFLLVLKDAPGGEPQGIAPDLARELARRVGVPIEYVRFDHVGKLADAVRDAVCDVGFLAVEPQRADQIAFADAYLEIGAGYLVPAGSPIGSIAEVDRPGVRIAVADRSAYELWLSRNIKNATLMRAESLEGSYQLFLREKLEVLAGLTEGLLSEVQKHPGARVLEGRFTAVRQSIGTPKNRPVAAAYLRSYVEDIKASGLVARTIEQHGIKGVSVAPPASDP